nr:unnamed protein product [Digitaria exilis]
MAADDFDGLPMFVEDDDEEAAAAKQKRRQQSQKPRGKLPWEDETPEERAKAGLSLAMMKKLYEYDPKSGHGCYTRVWFVDFSTLDIDEETQYGPMRFTDSLIGDDYDLSDSESLSVLCLKIRSSDAGYPINVYGTVIVRDRLDMKCIYIFRRNRNNCQLLESEGESLILTGPTRGIVFSCDAYFETNLKIKEDKESGDRQFSKAMIDVDIAKVARGGQTRTIVSWLSEVDLIFAYVKNALEGTIEMAILSGPDVFDGKITVYTTDVPNHILLYDSDVHGPNSWGRGAPSSIRVSLLVFNTARKRFRLTAAPDRQGLRLEMARAVLSRGELCFLAFAGSPVATAPADRHLEMWMLVGDDDLSGDGPRWRLRERIWLDSADLLPAFVGAEAVEGAEKGEEIFIRQGDRIDTYNFREHLWHKVSVTKSASLLMHRASVLRPEVIFGKAARALVLPRHGAPSPPPSFDRALAGRLHAVAKATTNLYLSGLNFDLFHGRWHGSNSARQDVAGPPRRDVAFAEHDLDMFSASRVHGSWDGVLCLQLYHRFTRPVYHTLPRGMDYVLWNPLTKAFATVPTPPGRGRVIGGYAHPVTRRFHLLHSSDEPVVPVHVGDLELLDPVTFKVMQVGDDAGWRELPPPQDQHGTSPSIFMVAGRDRPVSAHGNLHWLVLQRETRKVTLLVFDTARERFFLTAAPDLPGLRMEMALAVVSRGELCVLAFVGSPVATAPEDRHLEMWMLVDDDDHHSGDGPRWRLRQRIRLFRRDGVDLLPEFMDATAVVEAVEGGEEGEEIFIRQGDRIDAYNLREDAWRKVGVTKDASLVMHRASVLPPEVTFGAAARALVPPSTDRFGELRRYFTYLGL